MGTRGGLLIDPVKVIRAFQWLKANNDLYRPCNLSNISNFTICNSLDEQNFFGNVSSMRETVKCLEEVSFAPVDYCVSKSRAKTISDIPSLFIPRNDATPVSIYEMELGEEKAFPWLFPLGKFGFTFPRKQSVAPSMYFRIRLCNRHGFRRKNLTYLLHAAVSYDKLMLKKEIGIFMKMLKGNSNNDSQTLTTAKDVRFGHNENNLHNSYMFMKNIRGTVAYFRNALYNFLAMFHCLGPPTLFMTLSADDLHWPELGMILENLSYEDASARKSFYSSMRSDPLMTAIHFDRRFSALLKFVINGHEKPLGSVKDYFA